MILAFPAWRRGFFKATGGPITEALRRGHEVWLVHRHDDKPGEAVTREELEAVWPAAHIGMPFRADALLGPSLATLNGELPKARRCYNLDLAWEAVTAARVPRHEYCWASEYQAQLWAKSEFHYLCDHWMRVRSNDAIGHIVGSPMIDAFDVVSLVPRSSRPEVVLMALKFPKDSGLWRRTWYRWVGYRALVQAIRRFCDRMGMEFVIKTREKNRDPGWLAGFADRVVTDAGMLWPYAAASVIREAALVVHFQSGAALEAAFMGVPQVSIHLPHPHLREYPGHAEVYEASPGMQSWPDVVTGIGWESAPGFFDDLGAWGVVDPLAQHRYVKRFLGFDDCKVSQRILDLVEAKA